MHNPKFVTVKKTEVNMFELEGPIDEVINKLQMIRNQHGANLSLKINENTGLKIDVNGLHLETKQEFIDRLEAEKTAELCAQMRRVKTLSKTLSK